MHIYIFRLIVCFLAVLSINFELRQPHYFQITVDRILILFHENPAFWTSLIAIPKVIFFPYPVQCPHFGASRVPVAVKSRIPLTVLEFRSEFWSNSGYRGCLSWIYIEWVRREIYLWTEKCILTRVCTIMDHGQRPIAVCIWPALQQAQASS